MANESAFSYIYENLDTVIANFVTSFSSNVISQITPLVASGLVFYFIAVGILYLRGQVDDTLSEIIWRLFRVGLIVNVALVSGVYQEYISNVLIDLPDDLVTSLIAGQAGIQSSNGLQTLIDNILITGFETGSNFFKEGSLNPIPIPLVGEGVNVIPYICGALIIIASIACVIVASFWIIAVKILMGLLLGIAPLFIIALIWESTKGYFQSWLNTILSLILINILICAVCSIFGSLFDVYLSDVKAMAEADSVDQLQSAFSLLFIGLVTFGLLLISPAIAFQMTSGASSMGGLLGATMQGVTGFGRGAKSTAQGARAGIGATAQGAKSTYQAGQNLYQASKAGYDRYKESKNAGNSRVANVSSAVQAMYQFYKK